jgi:hypothetical protein
MEKTMKYIVTVQNPNPVIRADEMPNGTLAIAIGGEFSGELFYRNVAGIVGISRDRYWPSAYMANLERAYIPDFLVRPVIGTITIKASE